MASENQLSYEVHLPGPSLDNPALFDRYAQHLEQALRDLYPTNQGYSFSCAHKDKPRDRSWIIDVFRGRTSGMRITLQPRRETPHHAVVMVEPSSRIEETLLRVLGALVWVFLVIVFAAATIATGRLAVALMIAALLGVGWVMLGALAFSLGMRLIGLVLRNEFTSDQRAAVVQRLRAVTVPRQTPS